MGKYILKRVLYGCITILGISVIIFSIIHLIPGDPIQIMFGRNPNPELIELAKKHYGLDKPVIVQYFVWFGKLLKGDMGQSIIRRTPVLELLIPRIGRTISLTFLGIVFSVAIAIPTGIIAAWRHNTWSDFGVSSISLILISVPEFWIGIVFMIIFSVWLGIFPTSGYIPPFEDFVGWLKILILPALTVASVIAAQTTRMIRANMIEVMSLDYITLMKSAGVRQRRLLLVHAFRNAFIPVLTMIGIQIGMLMGGIVIVERVFTFPGLGALLLKTLEERDYPVLQACIMVYAVAFVLINIIIDVLYSVVNPKIRY
jgi:peptide/nickel transport system permease protein